MLNKFFEDCFKEAWEISKYSSCKRKKVGAIIFELDIKKIISFGFNGAKRNCDPCIKKEVTWKQDGCWSIHAEVNAIFNVFESYGFNYDLSGSTLFVTHKPCDQCIKYVDYFNIPLIIYDEEDINDISKWEGKIKIISKKEYETL